MVRAEDVRTSVLLNVEERKLPFVRGRILTQQQFCLLNFLEEIGCDRLPLAAIDLPGVIERHEILRTRLASAATRKL